MPDQSKHTQGAYPPKKNRIKSHFSTIRHFMSTLFALPIVLSILCGIGAYMPIGRHPVPEKKITRMPWLQDAIAYASEPLFSEVKDEQQA